MKKSSIVHGLHEINKTELSPDIFMRVGDTLLWLLLLLLLLMLMLLSTNRSIITR